MYRCVPAFEDLGFCLFNQRVDVGQVRIERGKEKDFGLLALGPVRGIGFRDRMQVCAETKGEEQGIAAETLSLATCHPLLDRGKRTTPPPLRKVSRFRNFWSAPSTCMAPYEFSLQVTQRW